MSQMFPRTRTGCLTCRQRKKKCDEVKPHCRACERNKLDCLWPPHIRRRFKLDDYQGVAVDGHPHKLVVGRKTSTATSAESVPPSLAGEVSPKVIDNTDPDEVVWSWGLNTFLSQVRAGMLLPTSQVLLSYYLEFTAPKLAPSPDVPFVSWVMPVAYNDDLLMHSILALAGAHLSYRSHGIEIQHATCRHYSLAVRTLRRISEDETLIHEPLVLIRVILAVIILCHYEVVSGNLDGSPFIHLRASRYMLLELRNRCHQINTTAELRLYGFLMELYSYIVLCNTITPLGMNCKRSLVHDSFLQSLDELKGFGAFGVMFGGGHGLFEMIPSISHFAADTKSTPSMGDESDDASQGRHETYKRLKRRTKSWHLPSTHSSEHDHSHDLQLGRKAALELCRQALIIFLESTLSPFSKYDSARIYHLQPLLDLAMSYLLQVSPTSFSCIVMWPLMIIGSCLVEDDQRRAMNNILNHNQYMMRNTAQASKLLELLWMDPDEYAIGPYGLGILMENYGLEYGVI